LENETAVVDEVETTVERHPALYTGAASLSGIEPNSDGYVTGEYWETDGLFLFQPTASTKIFEVSDEDIRRINVASASN
jgi:hypothetical protein